MPIKVSKSLFSVTSNLILSRFPTLRLYGETPNVPIDIVPLTKNLSSNAPHRSSLSNTPFSESQRGHFSDRLSPSLSASSLSPSFLKQSLHNITESRFPQLRS